MSYIRETPFEYIVPSEQDTEVAKISSRILSSRIDRNRPLSLGVLDDQESGELTTITLPAKAAHLLLEILVQMAEGRAITIIPIHAELTTQQAADVLNMSRPFLVQLLENGAIPFRKVGTHRRVLLSDIMVYQAKADAARKQSLDELVVLSQELGVVY